MKQYVKIYSIKCFLQIKKDPTNILLSIAFSIFLIRLILITACAVENFFEIHIVFCIESSGHSGSAGEIRLMVVAVPYFVYKLLSNQMKKQKEKVSILTFLI